jgi:hypothetical protein
MNCESGSVAHVRRTPRLVRSTVGYVTLILAAITHSFAILASDRCITVTERDASGRMVVVQQEDSDTKTILFDRRYVMGFAGLGRIRHPEKNDTLAHRERLESWMGQNVAGFGESEPFEYLADKFGTLYSQQNYLGAHTFLAVGYRTDGPRGATDAELVTVQNTAFRQSFDVRREPLEDRKFRFCHAGESLEADQERAVEKALQRSVKRSPRQPYHLVATFVQIMREVSATSDGRVGAGILVTTLSRRAVPLQVANTFWMEPPAPADYLNNEVSVFYPEPGSEPGLRGFQPAFISYFATGGAESVVGKTVPKSLGPLEGMGPPPSSSGESV